MILIAVTDASRVKTLTDASVRNCKGNASVFHPLIIMVGASGDHRLVTCDGQVLVQQEEEKSFVNNVLKQSILTSMVRPARHVSASAFRPQVVSLNTLTVSILAPSPALM